MKLQSLGAFRLFFFFLCFSAIRISFSQTFQRTFGSAGDDKGLSVSLYHSRAFPTSDGGYAVVGGLLNSSLDMVLVKMNSGANLHWEKAYGTAANIERAFSGIQTADGGYALAGVLNPGTNKMYFVKTDAAGTFQWSKVYAGSGAGNAAVGFSIEQTGDGGYIIGGEAKGFTDKGNDMYMVRTGSDGALLWSNNYSGTATGASGNDHGYQAIETSDGGFALAGYFQEGSQNACIVKTNSDGAVLWAKTFGMGANNEAFYSVAETYDGGYVLAGSTSMNGRMWLVKVDNSGALLWTNSIAFNVNSDDEEARYVLETPDRGFVIAGIYLKTGPAYDALLVKTNSSGTPLWAKTFSGSGGTADEFADRVSICPDGGFLVSGYCEGVGAGSSDIYVVKTNSDGLLTGSECSNNAATFTVTAQTPTVSTLAVTSAGNIITTSGGDLAASLTVKNACNNSTTLPVEMISFTGFCEFSKVVLRWITGTEINNHYFVIERSMDGKDFLGVEKIYGAGNSSLQQEYEFTDNEMLTHGILYYRLIQVDFNGQYEYFGPISVKCGSHETEITPIVSEGVYFISGYIEGMGIHVYSILGENINYENKNFSSMIDISNEPAGIYFVEIISSEGLRIRKIIKK